MKRFYQGFQETSKINLIEIKEVYIISDKSKNHGNRFKILLNRD
jgi:hypothetical protein